MSQSNAATARASETALASGLSTQHSALSTGRRFARHKPLAFGGGVALALLGLTALLAPLVATHDPLDLNVVNRLQAPSAAALFGTDEFGRDVFSRTVYGLRVAIRVAVVAVLISTVAGAILGTVSGLYGGWVDLVMQRVVDMFMAFPAIVLALAIVAVFGQRESNITLALALVQTPNAVRVVRSAVLSLRERMFVEAARSVGATNARIIARHLFPNTAPVLIIIATASLGNAVLAEASLSFLGVGIPAPNPSLGSMLSGSARKFATQAPWLVIFPGLVLSLAVFSANFLGDGLRDVLDPRLRGSR
jgi:peptide/nickel transport system permease protein